ncbi:hypothetical protein AVEN_248067-1 [Araneus ventricosus]|uniref:Uncharacterized protein n=1 Tax=Araneus ventricosus TaxID=182803 RepID=A0A4Y2KRJ9_ARAVE|nr:hypothetical protein AVEN_248067-1 [Araneus ventricosus]
MPRLPASHIIPMLGCDMGETLVIEKVNSKQFRKTIKDEHYPLLQEPGSVLVDHVAPSSRSAQNITNSILSYLIEIGFLLHDLDVIGCDEIVINKGWKTGAICKIEKEVKRPLMWGVLHFKELPFRHLFRKLDSETTGSKSISGLIDTHSVNGRNAQ